MLVPSIRHRTTLDASFEACRRLARATAGNFYYTFLTLPRRERRAMCALYAFLRIADDLGDRDLPATTRSEDLMAWETALLAAVDGVEVNGVEVGGGSRATGLRLVAIERPEIVLPAVASLVRAGELPLSPLRDVVTGVRRDLEPVDLSSEAALSDYCYYVAGAVGLACIHLWGCRDEAARRPAIACGEALQRTNILRDVPEDARLGRFYIARETCDRFDCTRSDLATGQGRERLAGLLADQIRRARACYADAEALDDLLPPVGRPILAAMIGIYGGLLERIARDPLSIYRRRVALPAWRKVLWVGQALAVEQARRMWGKTGAT